MKKLLIHILLGLLVTSVFPAGITLTQTPGSLYRETSNVIIRWQEPIQAKMKFGLSSGNYNFESSASGNKQLTIIPNNEGMTPGVYYCIISSGSLSSREFKLFVESTKAAILRSPQNNTVISSATPQFSWEPVAGVPFYHLILSDQPVELSEDQNGELLLNGGNIIWQIITPQTSARYGETDPSGFFNNINKNLPPILEGLEYNWIVLNNYNNHPAYSSLVQSGVSSFSANLNTTLNPPVLQSPQNNVTLAEAKITFQWSAVSGASSYQILLSESIEQDGSESSYIVWSPVTTDRFIELPARQLLKGTKYFWRVVALDQAGRGTGSDVRHFTYLVPTATLVFKSTDTKNTTLPRVELEIVPQDGSSEISKLLTADNGMLEQPVQPGEYVINAWKEGFADTSVLATANGGETVNVHLALRELYQSISGQVVDKSNQPISGAIVTLAEIEKGIQKTVNSDILGHFNMFLVPGIWIVWAEKSGYKRSDTLFVELNSGQKKTLSSKLTLEEKAAKVIGFVKTTSGIPIVSSLVTAGNGDEKVVTQTDNSGRFEMELLSGSWTIFAQKDGFVQSTTRTVSLTAGQTVILSPDLTLNSNAALVSGIASTKNKTVSFVTVEAIPLRGKVVDAKTNPKGAYLLSLEKGSYKLRTISKMYIPENEIYLELGEKQTLSAMDFLLSKAPCEINGFIKSGTLPVSGAIVTNGITSDTSKIDGSYSLAVPSGANTIKAFFKGKICAEKSLTLNSGEIRNNVNFEMTQAGIIEGTVTSGGQTVPYFKIVAKSASQSVAMSGQKDGTFWISVPAGVWNLTVEKVGFETGAFNGIAVNSGQTISGVDFNLVFSQAVLRGRVLDGSNDGVQNVNVKVKEAEVVAGTDRFGNYAVSLNPGSYSLTAQKTGFIDQQKSATVSKNQTTTINFNLTAQGTIRGIVKNQSNAPLDRIEVLAIAEDTARTKTDHAGEYVLYLNAGSYKIVADQLGYAAGQSNFSISLGQTITKNFTLTDAPNEIARIKGKILDSENRVMQSVGVQIKGEIGQIIYSDLNGLFDTNILETGKNYTIEPFAAGRFFVPASRNYRPLTVNQNNQNFNSGFFGDVSGNEKISSFDGSLVLRVKAEQDVSPNYQTMPRDSIAADVSGNKQVSPFDASLIFRYAAGLIDEFPSENTTLAKPVKESINRTATLSAKSIAAGEIQLELDLDNNSGIFSGDFDIAYDKNNISFVRAETTVLTENVQFYSSEKSGIIKIVFASVEPLLGDGPIARLVFNSKGFQQNNNSIQLTKAQVNEASIKIKPSIDFEDRIFASFQLLGNYPNPFNSSTIIRYVLPTRGDNSSHDVTVKIFNILGQPIKTLVDTNQKAGFHEINWDGSNDFGQQVPSGVYIYRIQAGTFNGFRKILLVK